MKRTKHEKILDSLTGRWGQTKRLRTLEHAKAVLKEMWAEKDNDGEWGIADDDCFRPATKDEARLLDRANNAIVPPATNEHS